MRLSRRDVLAGSAAALCSGLTAPVSARPAATNALPSAAVPDGLGVNIHFTDPGPGEMEMLAAGGFRWVRMDFGWGGTEPERGRYDFSAYDRLMSALRPHGIRAMFILDYSNRLYDNDQSPHTEEGRQAFARWAAAGARHFAGQGVLWEMYNEPNIGFWRPKPDVGQYAQLALAVGKALREAVPEETYVGPATSTFDFNFLEACFKAGLLEYWSAVSVHPYRQTDPETAVGDYDRLKAMIARYAPSGRQIPVLSGEWGYSSAWRGMEEERQGKLLARQWLVNLSQGVPLSIWYDWHDDGPEPRNAEHHFGTVEYDYHEGRTPVYNPKPAYVAAQTLTKLLRGYRYAQRLPAGSDENWLLEFRDGRRRRLVAWTRAAQPREIPLPRGFDRFQAYAHTGELVPPPEETRRGRVVTVDDGPQYLVPAA